MIPCHREHTYPGEYEDLARWFEARTAGKPLLDDSPVAHWESAMAGLLGMPYAVALNMGRRAMVLILEHLGVGRGDEVILPAYTVPLLAWRIDQMGATAVPADVDPSTFAVTPESLRFRVSNRTKAIVALHAYGAPCPVHAILQFGREHGIPVIEDCAHALGSAVQGKPCGGFGYASFFSFQPGKPINTYGGGMLVTRDAALAGYVRQRTAHDVDDPNPMMGKVRSCRLDDRLYSSRFWPVLHCVLNRPWVKSRALQTIRLQARAPVASFRYLPEQARIGLTKLATLNERLAHRRAMAALLRSLLDPRISVQHVESGDLSTWQTFEVVLPCEAGPVQRRLFWRGVVANTGEDGLENCGRVLGYTDCPTTDYLLRHAMGLPMYDDIGEAEIEHVAAALNSCLS